MSHTRGVAVTGQPGTGEQHFFPVSYMRKNYIMHGWEGSEEEELAFELLGH
jgi:hypothetical protein